ncbi:MAG: alpha/beta hydrolase [Deltaproteobacteria bacterium]|nr:alpha/beta hydrolase [Deltaproteobacteria bacterium]
MPVDGWVAHGDLRLHYLDWGPPGRPPVVLLHGGSAHAHWWDFTLPYLADRYRCIALDLRGHGDSGRPADGDYSLAAHAADALALFDALDLHRPALIGHSFGGFVAMVLAGQAPDRLAALALVDSRARIGVRSARLLEALRKLPHPRWATREEAITRFRLLPADTTAAPEVLAQVAEHGLALDTNGTWSLKFDRRALAGAGAQDLAPHLTALRCPVLAVRAASSAIVGPEAMAEYRTAVPHVELAEIADAHHHVMLDQPQALARVLGDFLDRTFR